MSKITVAGFGTCGDSKWREPFESHYTTDLTEFYNPVVENWDANIHPQLEAKMLQEAEVILFPVTNETTGYGSLAEIGFAIIQAINNLDNDRYVIILVDDVSDQGAEFAESQKARKLLLAHLTKLNLSNVYLVENFNQMMEVSDSILETLIIKKEIEKFSLNNQ